MAVLRNQPVCKTQRCCIVSLIAKITYAVCDYCLNNVKLNLPSCQILLNNCIFEALKMIA
jgi:hypothetical protein